MDPIYIPRLTHLPQQTEVIEFKETIPGLESLTAVQGWIRVTHCGTYLDVTATAETIVTLSCDRCLQQYNHRLAITPQEMIWLNDETADADLLFDKDLESEDLVETLLPTAHFDPTTWIYEQLCLELPLRRLCDQDCAGIALPDQPAASPSGLDSRWSALSSLKHQISDLN
jgi:uncharacterized protein